MCPPEVNTHKPRRSELVAQLRAAEAAAYANRGVAEALAARLAAAQDERAVLTGVVLVAAVVLLRLVVELDKAKAAADG